MDGQLKAKVKKLTMELAREEHARLRAVGTMVELEELACEIGDELTRQLMELEMADRSNEAAEAPTSACPDCGNCCGPGDSKSRELTSARGKIHYYEPSYYCPNCRRSFFPGSRVHGTASACNADAEGAAKSDLGRSQPEQL